MAVVATMTMLRCLVGMVGWECGAIAPVRRRLRVAAPGRLLARSVAAGSPSRAGDARASSARQINHLLVRADGTERILSLCAEHAHELSMVNEATAISRIGRTRTPPSRELCADPRFRALLASVELRIAGAAADGDVYGPRELANMAHGLAKRRPGESGSERTLRTIVRAAEPRVGDCNAQELANIAWACATAGVDAPELFASIAQAAEARIGEFKAQELANTAWAYATAGVDAPELFASIAQAAEARIGEFKAQELSNMAWAYATAGAAAPRLYGAIARAAMAQLAQLNTQAITNLAWAYARAGVDATPLYAALAHRAEGCIDEFDSKGIANVAWAFATAGARAPSLYAALARAAEARLAHFTSQAMANVAWAYATAGVFAPRLYDAIARHAEARMREFNAHELKNTAWAFATARMDAPRLFDALARESEARIGEFTAHDLATTAWAYATAGVDAPRLFDAIARASEARLPTLGGWHLANLAWAIALAGQHHAHLELLLALSERHVRTVLAPHAALAAARERHASERHAIALALLTARSDARLPSDAPARARLDSLLAACLAGDALGGGGGAGGPARTLPSHAQRALSAALRARGWAHEEEVRIGEGGLLVVDMACAASKVVVEYDGPSHFVTDPATGAVRLDGSSSWKARVLESLGWRVLRVPYTRYNVLAAGPDAHEQRERLVDEIAAQLLVASARAD